MAARQTSMRGRAVRTTTLAVLATVAFLAFAGRASAQTESSTDPIFVPGNPSCASLGLGTVSFKIDAAPFAGTHQIDSLNSVTVVTSDNVFFDWTATLGIDAVIVKGGPNSDAYVYDPPAEATGDVGLHAPINPNTGDPFGLSHIEFCFDYELKVAKTAVTSFTRTFNWTIDKSVTPASWELFRGDSGTSKYTVSVQKTGFADSNWKVTGQINVTNPTPYTVVTTITDTVSGPVMPIQATVSCPGGTATQTLAPGATVNCTYVASLPDASPRTNTARASSNLSNASPPVAGGTGTAAVDFAGATINEVNGSVTVSDSVEGSLGTFNGSGSATYTRTFRCDADEGTHANKATIAETGQSDSASVYVTCHDLTVSKTAQTSFTRTYAWTLDKTADPATKTIATGASFTTEYTISVDATAADSDHAATGSITVTNPAPVDATINAVSDIVAGVGAASVSCPVSFPHQLAMNGGTLTCTYSVALPNADSRTNTATATLQNHDYDPAGNATAAATTYFSGSAVIGFANATITHVDRTITVSDADAPSNVLPTQVTYGVDTLPKVFSYTRTIGPYDTCGPKTVMNTASFLGSDGAKGSDSATVTANVQCTLTVVKKLLPAGDSGLFDLRIDGVVKATNVSDGGTTGAQQVSLGSHAVSETAGTGTDLAEYVTAIGGDCAPNGSVSFAAGDGDKTCMITNTRKGRVTVKKTTDGAVNPSKSINFVLTGSGLPSGGVTLNTFGDQDGVLDFGYVLVPGATYTVCEKPVPAGFTSFWKLDGVIVTPYNPDASQSPPQDLGTRCYDFSAPAGGTRAFEVDNSHPGGEPRTIGYWRNWNKCTSGNQAVTAAKNGGAAAGVFIVEDLLPQTIGKLTVTTCAQAVKVLSKQDQNGKSMANDAAYELAAQLLAARLNLAAGAETCQAVQDAIVQAQALLYSISWTGTGTYLTKSSATRTSALALAATLDKYNNGNVC